MENKKLTPQESIDLITAMIQSTRRKVAMPNLRISIMWALLTITTALAALVLMLTLKTRSVNLIWFAIPVIGLPTHFIMQKGDKTDKTASTYVDKVNNGIWKNVGCIAILLSIICLVFNICGYPQAWISMLIFSFIVIGFGATATGIIVKEKSYIFGGTFSILAGFAVTTAVVCRIPLVATWVIPLYILCFLLMFIVPAFVIRKKLNDKENERT